MERKLITIKDVAAALGCSRTTIWRKVKEGTLPKPLVVCGLTRWRVDQIEALIDGATDVPVIRKRTRCAA